MGEVAARIPTTAMNRDRDVCDPGTSAPTFNGRHAAGSEREPRAEESAEETLRKQAVP